MVRKITDKLSRLKNEKKDEYTISDWLAIVLIYTFAIVGAMGTIASIIAGLAASTLFLLLLLPFTSTFIVCLSIILFIEYWG